MAFEKINATDTLNTGREKINQAIDSLVNSTGNIINVSGSPKGTFATLSALQSAYPNGTEGVFLVLENGHWYYYDSGWQDGGVYQASKAAPRNIQSINIGLNQITPDLLSFYNQSDNLFNPNTVIKNKTITNFGSYSQSDSTVTCIAISDVQPNTTYVKGTISAQSLGGVVFLDYEKKRISSLENGSGGKFTTPSTCYYIAYNVSMNSLYSFMLKKGVSLPSDYVPFGFVPIDSSTYPMLTQSKRYKGTFDNIGEYSSSGFISEGGKLYSTINGGSCLYFIGYKKQKLFARFVINPKVYSSGAGTSVVGISDGSALTNSIGFAFKPTATDNIIQTFNRGVTVDVGTFVDQLYYLDIFYDNGEVSCHLIGEDETEYFLKVTDKIFDSIYMYMYSKDTRGVNGISFNAMDYTCDFEFVNPQKSVLWSVTTNSKFRIYFPKNYDGSKKYNAIVCFHGNGTDETHWSTNENMTVVQKALVNAGYVVLTCAYKLNNATWGSKYGVNAYKEAYEYLMENFKINNIGIFANSMGSIESLNTLAERKIPAKCWCGTSPTYDLANCFSLEMFKPVISSAYNIASDGSDYSVKTNGRNPALMPPYTFGGIPMLIIGGTADTAIPQNTNGFKLYEDVQAVSFATKIEVAGGSHGFDHSLYTTQIVSFYNNNL